MIPPHLAADFTSCALLFPDLPCCYKIENQRCRDTCVRTLSTMTDQYKIAGELENICGPILPQVTKQRRLNTQLTVGAINTLLTVCHKSGQSNSVCPTVCPFVHLSIHLSVCSSVCLLRLGSLSVMLVFSVLLNHWNYGSSVVFGNCG